ncbi:hypothetical protein ACNF40_02890 [Cuniculiplasma sp. SKW4]|uniref:hypothetical protein n=1 Tax=Cuniculiplasma sp. SKW4 TaxID=3400171 RepID=UPI003FCF34C9
MMEKTERHTRSWYWDNMLSVRKPSGMRDLLCPFCQFTLESKSFSRDLEMLDHIDKKHPENVVSLWEVLHQGSSQTEKTKVKQGTLENFQEASA